MKDERVIGVEPWEEFPFNEGKLCPKGVKRYLQNTRWARNATGKEDLRRFKQMMETGATAAGGEPVRRFTM